MAISKQAINVFLKRVLSGRYIEEIQAGTLFKWKARMLYYIPKYYIIQYYI